MLVSGALLFRYFTRAEGLPAISSRSRTRSTSDITGIFLDASIAMGCSDERHQLRLT